MSFYFTGNGRIEFQEFYTFMHDEISKLSKYALLVEHLHTVEYSIVIDFQINIKIFKGNIYSQ